MGTVLFALAFYKWYNLQEVDNMPRQARIQSSTDYYHIMMRGNNRESIFNEDKQKRYFLESLKMQNEDQLIEIVAYCLMDNHVHIIVKANILDLAKAIKSINIKYAMNFNQKLDRVGHVFQDRFKSEAIEDDKYLLQVIRYIHNNPVAAKMVKLPGDYYWSSYNEYINKNTIIECQQKEFVLEYFSHNLNQFVEFHKQKDNYEYLEIKEDIENERLEQAQQIISSYFIKRGLFEAKQIIKNPVYLEELIQNLVNESRLTHRQIASLLRVSNNAVHKANLHKV
jgi:REP element-mobilizing transposase RayT